MQGPFWVSILVFTMVLILGRIMQLIDMMVNRGVSFVDILTLIGSILPYFLVFILPMATLMAVLMAFLRMSSDNEITAIKNAGVSLYQMLPPVAAISLFSYFCTLFLSLSLLPWGIRSTQETLGKILHANADVVMKEGVFNEVAGKAVIYMRRYAPKEKLMEDVLISDERDPQMRNTIVARQGRLVPNIDGNVISFRLYDGVITRVDPNFESSQIVSFTRYDLNLPIQAYKRFQEENADSMEPMAMNMAQLNNVIRTGKPGSERHQMALMEYHQRFALPVACLVMSLLGVSLGVQFSGTKKALGMVIALAVFFVYFILLSATRSLGEGDNVPVVAGTWMPNVLFGSAGIYMLIQTARERRIEWVNRMLISLSNLGGKARRGWPWFGK
ncbi:MAG: LPS export ABC transporter permease LptF [Deltaproteobacteria bacterium]|nr:LPS export ABC transporter permease LptF [Deltaproteobacteria bacterium]